MKKEYLPRDKNERLFHLIEECGEVLHALGKAGRFGMSSVWEGRMNAIAIMDEITDLEIAIDEVKNDLRIFINNEENKE